MQPAHFRPDVSLGNIITIATIVVGIALAYQQSASAIAHQARLIDKLEERLVEQVALTQQLNKQRADDRLEFTSVLVELKADLRYMRAQLEALARERASAPRTDLPLARPQQGVLQ